MDKIKKIPVSLFGLLIAASASVNAEEKLNVDESLSVFETALELTPDIDKGRELYKLCVTCHGPEGWGNRNGSYPQIAGQLPGVTIKQMADIRVGNRDNPIMRAFTTERIMGGAQDIADVAAYIAALPMTADNGQGRDRYLAMGKEIYQFDCADCHGELGEGNAKKHVPVLYGQHFQYLARQYRWIRDGRRRNANKEMVEQIQNYSLREERAVLAYTASLRPPEEKLAAPGWTNPDFPDFYRGWNSPPVRDHRRGSSNR